MSRSTVRLAEVIVYIPEVRLAIADGRCYQTSYNDPEVLPKYSHCPGSGFSSSDSQLEVKVKNGAYERPAFELTPSTQSC